MATYTVIQDIEAEDKLIGPLSLRQFIYAALAALCGYLSFVAFAKGATFLLVVFLPVMFFTGFFAIPWVGNQPTEVWALAKIRFYFIPRRRIWDQSGLKDLVTITVPKRVEKIYTNGLTQNEVHSRLRALADTVDSRGWAVKNVNTNLYDPLRPTTMSDSDRLISPSSIPQDVSQVDITASDDMLDEFNNPVAQNFDKLVHASSDYHRQQLVEQLKQTADSERTVQGQNANLPQAKDYWFLNRPIIAPKPSGNNTSFSDAHVVTIGTEEQNAGAVIQAAQPTLSEEDLAKKLKANRQNLQAINYEHMKVIQPLGSQTTQDNHVATTETKTSPVTPLTDPAKMLLANRNDLNITTIGRIANKQDEQPKEIVISLHDHTS